MEIKRERQSTKERKKEREKEIKTEKERNKESEKEKERDREKERERNKERERGDTQRESARKRTMAVAQERVNHLVSSTSVSFIITVRASTEDCSLSTRASRLSNVTPIRLCVPSLDV